MWTTRRHPSALAFRRRLPFRRGLSARSRVTARLSTSRKAAIAAALLLSGLANPATGAAPDVAAAVTYACGTPTAPSTAVGDAEIEVSYAEWKRTFVTEDGAGGHLRVTRPENGGDTVSEGIAYGMLLAAYQEDRDLFDGLWRYAQSHADRNGLMHWRVDALNRVIGENAASDADLDMALALVVADRAWGGYRADAVAQIDRIMAHEVEPGTMVLKPGDAFGGSTLTNPSYFSPGAYEVFRDYTGDARWSEVTTAAYRMLDDLGGRGGGATTGLVPDWMTATGEPVTGYGYDYSYDAVRAPWRLATHAAWTCDSRALAQLERMNSFFSSVGPANIKDGYSLDGRTLGSWHNASFVGPAGAAALLSGDAGYRSAMWDETVASVPENYYNSTLRLLSLLLMNGAMESPLAAPTPAPAPAPSPSTLVPASPAVPASCSVSYVVRDRWDGGFVTDVTVTNRGAPIQGWALTWTFRDGERVSNAWNTTTRQVGAAVVAENAGWNAHLDTGASVTFGFQGTHLGDTSSPSLFLLNGTSCTD